MNELALCAGADGIGLGLGLIFQDHCVVCHVEREVFAAANLVQKMEGGALAKAPVWDDVETFNGRPWRSHVQIITAGIPCQPFSTAGNQRGVEDNRWLWPAVWRVVKQVRPTYLFMEEVRPFIGEGLGYVLEDLASGGWSAEWDLFSAASLGAPHERERMFLLAYSNDAGSSKRTKASKGSKGKSRSKSATRNSGDKLGNPATKCAMCIEARDCGGESTESSGGRCSPLGDADSKGRKGQGLQRCERAYEYSPWPPSRKDEDAWREIIRQCPLLEPALERMADGMANQLDRCALSGNGVVPVMVAVAFLLLAHRLGVLSSAFTEVDGAGS